MAMCMTFHFLINDNHVHDAWVFAGIMTRQSQVLQLNRDPRKVAVGISAYEKQVRLMLWTLIMFQDTGVALFLKLPPNSIHTDIVHDSFNFSHEQFADMPGGLPSSYPVPLLEPRVRKRDLDFLRCVWTIGVFMQSHICSPRSLGQPICKSLQHRATLVESFRALWNTFPAPFNDQHPNRFLNNDARLAKQLIYLTNNFYHPLMLVMSEVNEFSGVQMDVYGTLEAAHEALGAFFAMHEMFGAELNGFWAMQHRSFEVAVSKRNPKRPSNPQSLLLITSLTAYDGQSSC